MQSTRSLVIALSMCAALASVASADVVLPISLNGGIGLRSVTSAVAIEAAPSYNWTLDLTPMIANGLTGSIVGFPAPLPLYGVNPADLVMAGNYSGGVPANLISRNFTFTDLGAIDPAYDFTVTLNLLADHTIQATVSVLSMGSFMPGGIIPMNPFMVPVMAVNAGGTASIVAVPAPGAAVLAGIGGLLTLGCRRRPAAA